VDREEFAPVTPGEMLKEEFLVEYNLSQSQLAKAIGISPKRITADTALRLGLYFGNSPEFWMNLQTHYDLKLDHMERPTYLSQNDVGCSGGTEPHAKGGRS
jgi:addiction module HigA family antidote